MRPWKAIAATVSFALLCVGPAHPSLAQQSQTAAQNIAAGTPEDPLRTAATHAVVLDFETGAILYSKDGATPMPPASMSKLMTMLIVAEKLKAGDIKLDTMMTVSEKAWRFGAMSDGSHMFLGINSQVSVQDLITGVIVVSANDACIVLAESISGSEEAFVGLMNERAAQLGLTSARFRNVTGLPAPDHVISAEDLARLAAIIIRDHPDLYKIYSQREFTYAGKTQANRNPLLGRFAGSDGVKTGHTEVSGYGMVGSAVQNGQRRIIVFNGMSSMAARGAEAERLMRSAFSEFRAFPLFASGVEVGTANVFMGSKKTVKLVTSRAVNAAFHRSARSGLSAQIVYTGPLVAPIKEGDSIAVLEISAPGTETQRIPLLAGEKVNRLGFIGRAFMALRALLAGEE
jgi:serine-type D-Ala-D-Ala carboxypeptidase (penicillin-binding protein 5/6)